MPTVEERLQAFGYVLPEPLRLPPGVTLPFPWVRVSGNRALMERTMTEIDFLLRQVDTALAWYKQSEDKAQFLVTIRSKNRTISDV